MDIATSGTMADLVSLAKESDIMTLRQACGALANLSENQQTHERLIGEWGASFLTVLVGMPDVGLVREVTRCLTNLAANYATHAQLVSSGAAAAFVTSANNIDAVTARFAALGLLNLGAQPQNHTDMLHADVLAPLLDLAGGAKRVWTQLKDDGSNEPAPGAAELAPELVEDDPGALDAEIIEMLGYDMESRRYATLALGNLAVVHSNHPELLDGGIDTLQVLIDTLAVEDLETRFNAAFTCNKLATNDANHEAMGASGLIPPLVKLAGDQVRLDRRVPTKRVSAQCDAF